ncbi:MAG: MaoC/PaaZ C-terminal domain-containing protein [Chloroflexi bacterium]|nr:MaoC/PaaZ C-terminal domain-containing protein [Chloroflexota bacterium]
MTTTWKTLRWDEVTEGQQLPTVTRNITTTTVISCAIASRDFIPLHHDRDFAQRAGLKDIIINTPTLYGFSSKYMTDWAGPEAELREISMRMMIPCVPGDTLTLTGKVVRKYIDGIQHLVDIEFTFTVPAGVNCKGKGTLALPAKSG